MEATMIKKIILLVLSFAFSVTSVVYGTVTKADPVSSGTGKGTSVKIADTSALSNVMSQIPSFEDYTGEQTIREKYPEFKPFTMVETGYGQETKRSTASREIVENDETKYIPLIHENAVCKNHSLSISFTEEAVYYHSIGSLTLTDIYYEVKTGDSPESDYESQEFLDAERTITNFDAEIYHSKDATLIKYNKWEIIEEVADTLNQYESPIFKAAPEKELTDEDDIMEAEMAAKAQKMREDNYGVWLELEIYSEEELAAKYSHPPADVESEAYMNYMLDYMVDEVCSQISIAERDSIVTANASNCVYLGRLASFITSENENVSFQKDGNEYTLINSKMVQTGVNEETGAPTYENKEVGKEAYIATIFGDMYNGEKYSTSVNFSYVVGSDVAVVDQNASWGTSGITRQQYQMDTVTHFLALDNTVAALEKNAKVKTISEAFGNGLREMVLTLMGGEEN